MIMCQTLDDTYPLLLFFFVVLTNNNDCYNIMAGQKTPCDIYKINLSNVHQLVSLNNYMNEIFIKKKL